MAGATRGQRPKLAGLATRVITAVVFGAILIAAVLWGRLLGWAAVVAAIAALASAEFYSLARDEHRKPNEVFGLIAVVAMPFAVAVGAGADADLRRAQLGLMSVVTGLVVASLLWHVAFRQVRLADTATTVFGAVYVGYTLSHLVLLRALAPGAEALLVTILSVWAGDVGAYFVGSLLGAHKMAPAISPQKTWEGFAGGVLATLVVWLGAFYVADIGLTLGWHAVAGVTIAIAAVLGDLAESRLKREAGVKDSGAALPGHGGFLDRFDSLILVSVVAYYLIAWVAVR